MIGEGSRVFGMIELEDLVKYCHIKYEILKGYVCFGGTINCKDYVDRLYAYRINDQDRRPERKISLNSIFVNIGKTLSKCYKTYKRKKFSCRAAYGKYIAKNIDQLHGYDNQKPEVETHATYDDKHNLVQVGVKILSMSKRIMNELFMEVLIRTSQFIYISNTDSLLIGTADVNKLASRTGSGLGQMKVEATGDGCIVVNVLL